MYHDESTKVSMVSGSRFAGPPHCGQATLMNSGTSSSGERPVGMKLSTCAGSSIGSCSSGTGTMPHSWQWIIGIGQPQ